MQVTGEPGTGPTAVSDAVSPVFISHASADAVVVREIVARLEELGVPCWLAPRDIAPGADYATEIADAIRRSRAVVLLLSARSNDSEHCLRELELAVRAHRPIVPLRLDDTALHPGFEYRLSTTQWIDHREPGSLATLAARLQPAASAEPAAEDAPRSALSWRRGVVRHPLVGREDELARAQARLDEVLTEGSARFVLVGGESGLGKSALIAELAAEAISRGIQVCSATCGGFTETIPFFAVQELRRQLGDGEGDAAIVKRLYGPASQQATMASLADSALVEPSTRREALLATFSNVVFGVARVAAPLMLVIDDLESIDKGSVDAILCLLARHLDGPVLVVGAYRSDLLGSELAAALKPLLTAVQRSGAVATSIELAPIGRASYAELIGRVLGGPVDLSGPVLARLWDATEGNPLFLKEIVRTLAGAGPQDLARLERVDGVWRFFGSPDAMQIPRSVEEVILRNLAAIVEGDRDLLEAVAVVGKQFGFGIASALSPADEAELLDTLERFLELSVIRELADPIDFFEFSHNRVRDALYGSLSSIRRRRIHSRVADVLIADGSGSLAAGDAEIGDHLFRAGRYGESIPYLYRTAERMRDALEGSAAARQFDRVQYAIENSSEPADDVDAEIVALDRIEARKLANMYDEALALAEQVAAEATTTRIRGWAHDHAGDLYWAKGRSARALEAYAAAEELAGDDAVLALEVYADLAELHDRERERHAGKDAVLSEHHGRLAAEYLERQGALAEASTDHPRRARYFRNRAKALRLAGRLDESLRWYEDALAEMDPRISSHQVLISYAKTLRFVDRWDDAAATVSRVYEWGLQTGARRTMGIALHYRAMIEMDRSGPTDAAKADVDAALALHTEIGYERGVWEVRMLRGEWFLLRGDETSAIQQFELALGMPGASPSDLRQAILEQLAAIDEDQRAERLAAAWQPAPIPERAS